jgi:TATA-binding protein-associated factor Taf7
MEIEFVGLNGQVFDEDKVESMNAKKMQQNLVDIPCGYELNVSLMGTQEQVFKTTDISIS